MAQNKVLDGNRSSDQTGADDDLHLADQGFRLRMLGLLALCIALAALVILMLPGWLEGLRGEYADHDPQQLQQLLRMCFTALAVMLVAPMLLLARLALLWAGRIRQAGQFPTADMKTMRDVPIRRGDDARRIARWHRLGAATLLWLSVGVMAWVALIWLR